MMASGDGSRRFQSHSSDEDDILDIHQSQTSTSTRRLLATDHVILNHGQVTWTTSELAPPLLTTTPHQREDVSALDRFNVHRCPTRRVFGGLITCLPWLDTLTTGLLQPLRVTRKLNSKIYHPENDYTYLQESYANCRKPPDDIDCTSE
ncbi:uncharacterized protein TNCV_1119151 [Trichonephila clavipes]|uniref:Uncharacterized protein n=1 Tax=Trichonephila clavipes TaxID=2585209 RepID=A0A8X6SWI6_TRICX|nr:uncharacterized protein TNCV_1119151 [Trichonephila clavipes]